MYNILICDDEPDIISALRIYLSAEGYNIYAAENGVEAISCVRDNDIHLILMDIMMPKMDGITAMTRLRETSNIPIILLTAKSEDTDKILGLNVGADDYIVKPFNPVEVMARVRSQLRRYMQLGGSTAHDEERVYTAGGISLDDKAHTVTLDGDPVTLTPTEYDILKMFLSHPNEVLAPHDIYKAVWGDEPFGSEGTVAVHIRHLREKLEINPSEPRYLKVVWGRGYKLQSRGER